MVKMEKSNGKLDNTGYMVNHGTWISSVDSPDFKPCLLEVPRWSPYWPVGGRAESPTGMWHGGASLQSGFRSKTTGKHWLIDAYIDHRLYSIFVDSWDIIIKQKMTTHTLRFYHRHQRTWHPSSNPPASGSPPTTTRVTRLSRNAVCPRSGLEVSELCEVSPEAAGSNGLSIDPARIVAVVLKIGETYSYWRWHRYIIPPDIQIRDDLGTLERPHCSPSLGIMVYFREIIPFDGRRIQVSEVW